MRRGHVTLAASALAVALLLVAGCVAPRPQQPSTTSADQQPLNPKTQELRAPPQPEAPVPSGGDWVPVGSLRCCPEKRPTHGRIAYVAWSAPSRCAIRVADFATGQIVALDWTSANVSRPTLVDETHVLFSSDDLYICLADMAAGTVRIVAKTRHYLALGYRGASGDVLFSQLGPEGLWVWALPISGDGHARRTEATWSPATDDTAHRRIRCSPDGSWLSLPMRPLDASANYAVVRWSDGKLMDETLDAAWPDPRYQSNSVSVDFGEHGLYSLDARHTDRPARLMLYHVTDDRARARQVLTWAPSTDLPSWLAVSEALNVAVVGTRAPKHEGTLALTGLSGGGELTPLCDGWDPDIWPR
jgi:hypothetical protein